jgi:hypothetical protein
VANSVSILISLFAFGVSAFTAWVNFFRRGNVRLTNPAFIAFQYDLVPANQPLAKIFIRALLYSTGKRGHVIENMYLVVRSRDVRQIFSVWGYGDEKLARGSGLFVGETGVAANHHFNPPFDAPMFQFPPGEFQIEIHASLPGKQGSVHLSTVAVTVPSSAHLDSNNPDGSVWFDWEPEAGCYHAQIETKQRRTLSSS